MPERRGFRLSVEVVFLLALAAALSLAELKAITIAALMLLGWLVVALLEWVAWRGEAHYGRGLPPRYYVPQSLLPPPVAVEQAWRGYPSPEQHEDAPTWIAPRALRSELLDEWPLVMPIAVVPEPDPSDVAEPDPSDVAESEPSDMAEPDLSAVAEDPSAVGEPEPDVPAHAFVPELLDEQPVSPVGVVAEPAPLRVDEPDLVVGAALDPPAVLATRPDPQADVLPGLAADQQPRTPVEETQDSDEAFVPQPIPSVSRLERHRIDPLRGQERRRLPWRRGGDTQGDVAVPVRPDGLRPLPRNRARKG
jgi:hypothetical protein